MNLVTWEQSPVEAMASCQFQGIASGGASVPTRIPPMCSHLDCGRADGHSRCFANHATVSCSPAVSGVVGTQPSRR